MTTSNGQLVGPNGQPLFLKGINWFGFDDANTMLDGLWEGGSRTATASHTASWQPCDTDA